MVMIVFSLGTCETGERVLFILSEQSSVCD